MPGAIPAYALLAHGDAPRLMRMTAATAVLELLLTFTVASRAPRPTPVAVAACVGYAAFSALLVTRAAPLLHPIRAARGMFLAASFVPALWGAALALGACALGGGGVTAALVRSLVVLAGFAPVVWWFGRGLGLRRLARAWLPPRVAAA